MTQLKKGITDKSSIFLFFSILIIPFLHSDRFIDPVILPKYLGLSFFLLAYGIFLFKGKHDFSFCKSKIVISYVTYLLITGVTIIWTINFADGVFEWLKSVLFFIFLIFLVLAFQNTDQPYIKITRYMVIMSLLANLIAFYQLYSIPEFPVISHKSTYMIKSTFANRNLFSQVIFLTLPFTIFGFFRFQGIWKIIAGIATLFTLINITIVLTRSVWVAFFISLLVGSTLYLFLFKPWKLSGHELKAWGTKLLIPVLVSLIVIGGAVYSYSKMDSFETFGKQAHGTVNFHYGTSKKRFELWKRSLNMFTNAPITGVGLGAWKIEVLKYGQEGLQSMEQSIFYQRPHSDFLWVLSESGVLGLLAYAGIFLFALIGYFRLIKNEEKPENRWFFLLMFSGIIGYLIIALLSFPKERVSHQLLLAFLLLPVLLETNSSKETEQDNGKPWFGILSIGFLILILIPGLIRANSVLQLKEAFHARSNQQWKIVIEKVGQASNLLYKLDPMSTPLAWYSGSAFFNLGKIDEAHSEFKRAYEVNPNHIHVLNNLGTCYELNGNHEKAEEYYQKALAIAPDFDDALINLSAVYYNTFNYETAYELLREADPEHPNYKTFLVAVAKENFTALPDHVEEEKLKQKLGDILNSDEWIISIHKKSLRNEISFERQIVLDAIYVLHIDQKIITFEESKELKNKYKQL